MLRGSSETNTRARSTIERRLLLDSRISTAAATCFAVT